MKFNRLGSTDMIVSQLAFGGSAIGGHFCPINPEVSCPEEWVSKAVDLGMNYFDTAPWYGFGRAEAVLGKALENVPRSSYYIASKVGRYDPDPQKMFDFSSEKTLSSVEESLQKLGCQYLDLIQVHDVEFASSLDVITSQTLPALQKIKEEGKTRYIGITGYNLHVLQDLINRSTQVKIDTVLSYCRCCIHDNELINHVAQFKANGLGVIDAAGLGMGLYVSTYELPKWHPAPQDIKDACKNAAAFCQDAGVNFTKLALHYNLTQQGPDTHLISCTNLKDLRDNIDVCNNGLNAHEEEVLNDVQHKFFASLKTRNWEGIELNKYRSKLTPSSRSRIQ